MAQNKLQKILKEMAAKEKKIKEFRKRLRMKGKVLEKSLTKNGNIKLRIGKGEEDLSFIVIKTHKDRFALANKLEIGSNVYAEGLSRFRAIICTRLKRAEKSIDGSMQRKLI